MKKLSIVFVLAMVIGLSMLAVPAAADGPADYDAAVKKAADRLVALQGTDGGWDWIVTGLTAHSGTYPSPANIFGVTALGLIDAYQVTGDEAYKTAAEVTADHLKGLSRATDPNVRIQSFDYRFLVEFSALSGDTSYKNHAVSEWNWVKENVASFYADGNQETIYTFWYTSGGDSHGFAAWQAGPRGMAALAMDDTSWASNMAVVLAGHLADIAGTDECRFIGRGHALEFLNAVDSTAYATEIADLISNLTGSQETDGSWLGSAYQGTVQNTAYAVMGLAAAGEGAVARDGADWLVANQTTTGDCIGGWTETDTEEYSEVDSEALQAIKSVLEISSLVSMTANIPAIVCISVSPTSIDYGTISAGYTQDDTLTVSNCGTVDVLVTHEVVGDTLFTDNLGVSPPSTSLALGGSDTFLATLNVPSDYQAKGVETGTIIFWAEQQ